MWDGFGCIPTVESSVMDPIGSNKHVQPYHDIMNSNAIEIKYTIPSPCRPPSSTEDNKLLKQLCEIIDSDFDMVVQRSVYWSNQESIKDDKKSSTSNSPTVSETDGAKKDQVDPSSTRCYNYAETPIPVHRNIGLGLSTNTISFSNTENIFQHKQTAHECHIMLQQVGLKENPVSIPSTSGSKYGRGESSCHKRKEDVKDIEEKVQDKSVLIQPKQSQSKSKVKKKTDTYVAETDNSMKSVIKQKRKQERELMYNKNRRNIEKQNNEESVNEEPVIVARDIDTLLAKFEAESVSNASCLDDKTNRMRSFPTDNKIQHGEQPKESNLHKNIREPNQVIDRRKMSIREKKIMVIPALPNVQKNAKRKRTRDTDASVPRSNHPETVTNNTENVNARRKIVELDHDYCRTSFSVSEHKKCSDSDKVTTVKKDSNRSNKKQSVLTSSSNTSHIQNIDNSTKNNSKKYSTLKSGEVSGNSEKQSGVSTVSDQIHKPPIKLIIRGGINVSEMEASRNQKKSQDIWNNALNCSTVHNQTVSSRNLLPESNRQPETGINILRQDVASNKKSKPMVSVLKKSINAQQTPIAKNKETTVTTINSSNDKVQNIIVQETEKEYTPLSEGKQKKLSLEEYRLLKSKYAKNAATPTAKNDATPTAKNDATRTAKNDATPTAKSDATPTAENNTTPPVENDTTATAEDGTKPVTYCEVFTTITPCLNPWGELVYTERIYDKVGKSFKEEKEREGKDRPKPILVDTITQTDKTIFAFPPNFSININGSLEQNSSNTSIVVDDRLGQNSFLFGGRRGSDQSESCKRDVSPPRISHRSCPDMRLSFSSESTDSLSHSRSGSRSPRPCSSSSSSPPNYGNNRSSSSGSRNRECRPNYDIFRQNNYDSYKNWKRSPNLYKPTYDMYLESQEKADLRMVLHVSRLPDTITKADLRRKFESFGPIDDISLHFPDDKSKHNYAFVDFVNPEDCHRACAHGNDDPRFPEYLLGFGKRREYVQTDRYIDLDSVGEEREDSSDSGGCGVLQNKKDDEFINELMDLIRVAKAAKRSKDDKFKCNPRKRERAIAAKRRKDDKLKCNPRKRKRAIAADRSKDDKFKCILKKRERAVAARRSRGD